MKKIKELYNKLCDWMTSSGRAYHIFGGLASLALNLILGTALLGMTTITAAIVGTVNTGFLGLANELKDKIEGKVFDWSDFVATMYFPIILWASIGVYALTILF